MNRKRGETKRERHLASRDVQAFLKVLRMVFPNSCDTEDPRNWAWHEITTADGIRQKILMAMRDFRDIDPNLFRKWDFSDINGRPLQLKLASYISNTKKSVMG